jgi:hypothetical protein
VLFELTPTADTLESTFMELTQDSVQYHATSATNSNRPATTGKAA